MTAFLSVPHYVRGRSAHRRHERGDGWVLPSPSAVRDPGAPADRKLEQAYVGRRCRGSELRHHTKAVRGTSENPMQRDEVDFKSYDLLAPVLGKARARKLCDAVWAIEKIKDVRKLRPLLQA